MKTVVSRLGAFGRLPGLRMFCCSVGSLVLVFGLWAQESGPAPVDQTDDTLPEPVLPWVGGYVPEDQLIGLALPQVVWQPAVAAASLPAPSAGVFVPAAALALDPEAAANPVAQLLEPVPGSPASPLTQKTSQTAAPPAVVQPPLVATATPAAPVVPTAKKPAVTETRSVAKKPLAVKDPVPSPAAVHNKELAAKEAPAREPAAKARPVASLNAAALQIVSAEAGDPFLVPAPQLPQLSLPAQSAQLDPRTLVGTTGTVVEVPMTGRGWIYTGAGQEAGLISFVDKRAGKDGDVFRFRLSRTGMSRLGFTRQDLVSGLSEQQDISLLAQPAAPAATGPAASAPVPGTAPAGAGAAQAAAGSSAGSTPSSQPAAGTSPAPAPMAQAVSLSAQALAGLDPARKLEYARQLGRSGRPAEAVKLYQDLLGEASLPKDEILFALAGLYQDAAAVRDLRQAYELYVQVQKEFPRGSLAGRAKEQARYLKRTFQFD